MAFRLPTAVCVPMIPCAALVRQNTEAHRTNYGRKPADGTPERILFREPTSSIFLTVVFLVIAQPHVPIRGVCRNANQSL